MRSNEVQKYQVKSADGKYIISADYWSVGKSGLKFYKNKEMVAWFTTWDYWILENSNE